MTKLSINCTEEEKRQIDSLNISPTKLFRKALHAEINKVNEALSLKEENEGLKKILENKNKMLNDLSIQISKR